MFILRATPFSLNISQEDNPMLNFDNIQSLPGEVWKAVDNYDNLYFVSNLGRVHNNKKIMKTYRINSGYLCIDLVINKLKSKYLVHRLVASHFCKNGDNLPEVNHIDENKDNNASSNLEWCTSSHNKRHSMASGAYDTLYTARNSLGKKHLPNRPSNYFNVGFDKRRQKWVATIRHQGKSLECKRFDLEIDAAKHVNYLIDKYELHDRPRNIIE